MITTLMMIFVLLSAGVHGWRLSDQRHVVVLPLSDVVATYPVHKLSALNQRHPINSSIYFQHIVFPNN